MRSRSSKLVTRVRLPSPAPPPKSPGQRPRALTWAASPQEADFHIRASCVPESLVVIRRPANAAGFGGQSRSGVADHSSSAGPAPPEAETTADGMIRWGNASASPEPSHSWDARYAYMRSPYMGLIAAYRQCPLLGSRRILARILS